MAFFNPVQPRYIKKGIKLYEIDGTRIKIELVVSPSPGVYEIWAEVVTGEDKGSTRHYMVDEHHYSNRDEFLRLYRKNPMREAKVLNG